MSFNDDQYLCPGCGEHLRWIPGRDERYWSKDKLIGSTETIHLMRLFCIKTECEIFGNAKVLFQQYESWDDINWDKMIVPDHEPAILDPSFIVISGIKETLGKRD